MDKNAKKLIMLLGTPVKGSKPTSNMPSQKTSKPVKKKSSQKKKNAKKAATKNTLPWSSQNKGC